MNYIYILEYLKNKKELNVEYNKYFLNDKKDILYNNNLCKKTELKFKKCFSYEFLLYIFKKYKRCTFVFWNLKEYNKKIKIYNYGNSYCLLINFSDIKKPYYEIMFIKKGLLNEYLK